jgi:hypothetical protein
MAYEHMHPGVHIERTLETIQVLTGHTDIRTAMRKVGKLAIMSAAQVCFHSHLPLTYDSMNTTFTILDNV